MSEFECHVCGLVTWCAHRDVAERDNRIRELESRNATLERLREAVVAWLNCDDGMVLFDKIDYVRAALADCQPPDAGEKGARGMGKAKRAEIQAAWNLVSDLPQQTLDAIALIIDHGAVKGDYVFNGEDSVWMEDARSTLRNTAQMFREMKTIHDSVSVLDSF